MSEIDRLTLDIGLTSDEFQSGVNKILGSMERMQSEASETGESMAESFSSLGSSVASLAMRFAGMFLAFKGIEGLVDYFKDLSRELAHLGFAGRYLGQSAAELSRFGEVAKLAGGQSQDAIAAVQGLESAIFGLEFQGQISQNLLMLQRLGVGYLTTAGQMRSLKDIATETAAALEKQLPGDANRALRVQWAAQIFGPGGLSNAIGGGVTELRKFYSESARDQKTITDKVINAQMHLQQEITRLAYDVRSEAATILDRLTPAINELIHTIQTELIPTIDELIGDLMAWMHPVSTLDKAATGPMGLGHPINDLAHFGAWMGQRAADFHDWWVRMQMASRKDTLAAIKVPPQVTARMAPGANLDSLKYLHLEAGGDAEDPTWSKALTTYLALGAMPGGADAFAHSIYALGLLHLSPSGEAEPGGMARGRILRPHAGALSTPHATRPTAAAPGAAGSKPTASLSGPRVQIGSIGPIYTQATDAYAMARDVNRALERKLIVVQSDPGLV
jgi:hypothetical protein